MRKILIIILIMFSILTMGIEDTTSFYKDTSDISQESLIISISPLVEFYSNSDKNEVGFEIFGTDEAVIVDYFIE